MQKQQKLSQPLPLDLKSELFWQFLDQKCVPLWSEGKRQIPLLEINDNVLKALAFARRCGSLRVGLEQIQTILQTEEAGLVLMNKDNEVKKIQTLNVGRNISRLCLVSNDGAERFYRHYETILNRYCHRLLGIKLNVPASVLGNIFYGREKDVKAVFVNKKDAVLRVLSSFL